MAGLSDQPMAAGDVSTNGVATSREHVAQSQSRAYGRFAFGRTPVINVIVLAVASLILGSLISSQASGTMKAVLFVSGCLALSLLTLAVRGWFARQKDSEDK